MTRSALALLCFVLLACDGVGRALVTQGGPGGEDLLSCEPIECTDVILPEVRRVPASFTDPGVTACKPAAPQLCEPVSEPSPDLGVDEPPSCRRTLSLDDDFDEAALSQLYCGELKLVRTQAGEGVVRLSGVRWLQVSLEIETSDPLRLELSDANLVQVSLRLRGPVEVSLLPGGKAERVAVTSDDTAANFELVGSAAETLRVGDEDREYVGRVTLLRSNLSAAELRARELHFETVSLRDATIDARHLYWFDVAARRVRLAVDDAAISASRLDQVDIARCGQLSMYRSFAATFRIAGCSGDRTRLFESQFSRGSLDGVLAGDTSEFNQVMFGFHEPTVLQLWDSSLGNTNFCGGVEHVTVSGRFTASCAACRELDGDSVPIDPCMHEQAKPLVLKSCTQLDELPICMPKPERMRPPFS